eukprot:CAMPEP_0115863936 /NCGR_PEP_ID=MMETSP0287-20121206/18942_1 /TAXON_ID=412157 /ORGANISM="Chrysochromulina rotalis, Strain UIO044" /LENGTH=113 /DNA_ID=CAMNT_0003318391 /DNA_START=18 /DNA_END=355 /DNA_ORIENTATION=-
MADIPSDPELVQRIQKLAAYVAKNASMEDHVRGKQESNPDFAFLSGGEGSAFYQAEKVRQQQILAEAYQQQQMAAAPPPGPGAPYMGPPPTHGGPMPPPGPPPPYGGPAPPPG